MLGQMMHMPLNIPSILDFAAKFSGEVEVVSRTVEGPIHRYTYADAYKRVKKLANALTRLGVRESDILGTLAWNGYRHFELYYAIAGIGAVCHTINPRLFPDQIAYIIDHSEDRFIFLDLTFVKLVEGLSHRLPEVRGYVILTDREHMPATSLPNALCYEDLLEAESDEFAWPDIDENSAASLCYTSGTTGNPRGVLYSHRSLILHSYASSSNNVFGLSCRDAVLPVVPMFHVNAWGLPYSAPMMGAKLVLPGPHLDGANLQPLMEQEGVTFTAGVPTVWLNLLNHLENSGTSLPALQRVVVGGSACPQSMMENFERRGIHVIHAWGMTETSPLGAANVPTPRVAALPETDRHRIALKQGRPLYGIDLKIVDANGEPLPHDGTTRGALKIRGAWVCGGYYKQPGVSSHDEPGWFETGDVATIDPYGYMEIVDRTKDVIKSGGEWISSIQLEDIAMSHPAVREAAAIGLPDERWGERPCIIVVLRDGATATADDIRAFYTDKISKWSLPDKVLIVDELPHTATGKLQKMKLRELYIKK